MPGTILTALAKHEADTHLSEGRIEEALDIYNTLLSSSPDMSPETKASILSKIKQLRNEMDKDTQHEEDPNIEETIQKFQKAMARDKSAADLQKEVKALYKKGLYADALENLKLLIIDNAADEFCVKAVIGSMLHLYAKDQLALAVNLFLTETFEDIEKAALFKTMLADKMAKMGYAEHAELLQ